MTSVQRIATVALVVILFDSGLTIGWRRFRTAAALQSRPTTIEHAEMFRFNV